MMVCEAYLSDILPRLMLHNQSQNEILLLFLHSVMSCCLWLYFLIYLMSSVLFFGV